MEKQNTNPAVSTAKKQDGAKKQLERSIAIAELVKLSGSDVAKIAKAEQDKLLIIIGQLLGIVDDKGIVK